MDVARFWRHVRMSPARAARCFPDRVMQAIAREVAEQEKRHRGEVCFVVESELETPQLWRDLSARDRAREIFARHGVWNTEENNGVLLYVLLADRRVEIVADRGIDARVAPEQWRAIVEAMDAHFRDGRYEEGAIAGVRGVSDLLATHFPARGEGRNELPDAPRLL